MARSRAGFWSYNAGERQRNWVRAFEKEKGGTIYLEWMEGVRDEQGDPVFDPITRKVVERRKRMSTGHTDRSKARRQAEDLAERFGNIADEEASQAPLTLRQLLNLYLREQTPTKSAGKQAHDRRAAALFLDFFDARPDPRRRTSRLPGSLDKRDWDEFVEARRNGTLPGCGTVRNRVIEYDLKFLIAVLGWAEGAKEEDRHHLVKNPWSRERRKAQRMEMPREKNPVRPSMTLEQHEALTTHSPNWRFALAMDLCRETMHRRNSVRQIAWTDLDLAAGTVRWRGEFDKNGIEAVTPLSPRAIEVIRGAPRVPGSVWVIPSEEDPNRPVSIHVLSLWLQRAKQRSGVTVKGLGFHGQKRAGVRRKEFRELPPKVQEALTGTNHETLRKVYDDVAMDDMRSAMERLSRGVAASAN